MNRRNFIHQTIIAGTAMTVFNATESQAKGVEWQIGCFNRPWTKWPFDQTLKEIKSAGYKTTGLLTRTKEEPFISTAATVEYLHRLKTQIAASGLGANMGALSSRHNVPLEDSIRDVRTQIDNAHFLSLKYVMTFGADNPKDTEAFVKVMADAAAYGQEKGVAVLMKPHGGISGAAAEIVSVVRGVGHKNFSVWYDAGNIIYY